MIGLPKPETVLRWHMLAIGLICLPAIADVIIELAHPHVGWLSGVRTAFNLDEEMNVPSAFSAAGWVVLAAAAAWLTTLSQSLQARFTWALATVVALFLATDELLQFHEQISDLVGKTPKTGFFWQAWTAVYGSLALAGLAAAAPAIWKMAPRERAFLALGAMVFLVGAIGFEAIGGTLVSDLPFGDIRENPPVLYRISVICEESLEMIGLALALRGVFGQAMRVSALSGRVDTGRPPGKRAHF